jgi:hypothetical protein
MAEKDEEDPSMTRDAPDDAELAAFFAAARADEPAPRLALLNAVLADAAAASAARARAAPERRRRWGGLSAVLAPIGGWRGATALATCVAIGFGAGLLGGDDVGAAVWGDTEADPVGAFFDLVSAEG